MPRLCLDWVIPLWRSSGQCTIAALRSQPYDRGPLERSRLAHALTQFDAAPAAAPRPIAPLPVRPKNRMWRWVYVSIFAIVLGIAAWLGLQPANKTASEASLRTAAAQKRELVRTLRLNGKVEATRAYIVAAPSLQGQTMGVLVVTRLAKSGSHARKGDVLVEFDRQDQLKDALDRKAEYLGYEDQIKKKQADQAAALAKDDSELKQAEDAVHSAEWEIHRNEVVSRIDAEKNQEALEAARAQFAQLKSTYELKRRAESADLHILEIERNRSRNAMQHAERNAQQLEVRSPLDGIVVLNTIWKNGTMGEVQEGDEVRSGLPFMQVMSPGSMRVRARVNQADIAMLRPGQLATVHLDAYPQLALSAQLERTSAVALSSTFSNYVRTFAAVFTIKQGDPNVMPDLSAAVDVELGRTANVIVVPRDAVLANGTSHYVWIADRPEYRKTAVETGAFTEMEIAITSGLMAGDVVLRNPENLDSEKLEASAQ